MKQIYLLSMLLVAVALSATAQNAMRREGKIKVVVDGDTLRNPWVGGLHTPQFSEADIDGDGHNDLVIFNRGILASNPGANGYKLLTFKNNGTPNQVDYHYKPEWEAIFPPMLFWAKMDDLNCDNIPDLMSANNNQLPSYRWYKGMRDNNGLLYFEYKDTLATPFYHIELQRADFPGVGDVDGDGDVDFINFQTNLGYFGWYRGTAIDDRGVCDDSLTYQLMQGCFGSFAPLATGIALNYNCPWKTDPITNTQGTGSNRHNGGAVLIIDMDADGDMDLLHGDVDGKNVNAIYNGGTPTNAFMDSVDRQFPSYDVPVLLHYYPIPFGIDVNNDGKKDVVVAPGEPRLSSSKNAVWWYKNISPNDSVELSFMQSDFLEGEMVDLGLGAIPTFVDYNGDSLLDLVVGNHGYFRDSLINVAQLALFVNIGTPQVPIFELLDDDWLDLSTWYPAETLMAFAPTFGDIDSDGDLDLFVGDTSGYISFFENTAGPDSVMAFAPPVRQYADINSEGYGYSAPYVYDVNADGLPDLLIGNALGVIRYFENRGTTGNPVFDPLPTNALFGLVDVSTVSSLDGYSRPIITTLDTTGTLYLLSGNEEGNIYGYEFDRDSIYSGSFRQVFNFYSGIDAGERSTLTVADLTSDGKPEMIVGNRRGGLEFFTLSDTIENIISAPTLAGNAINITVAPNPTSGEVFISVSGIAQGQPLTYSVMGLLGNVLLTGTAETTGNTWQGTVSIDAFPAGLYLVRISQAQQHRTVKLIKY